MAHGRSSSTTSSSAASSTDGPVLSSRSGISKVRSIATQNAMNRRRTGSRPQASSSGATSRRDGFAQSARKIAQYPKWQGQVIFAYDLPTIGPPAFDRGFARYIPTVVFVSLHDPIVGPENLPVRRQVAGMNHHQDQPRLPASDVEAAQHYEFVPLH